MKTTSYLSIIFFLISCGNGTDTNSEIVSETTEDTISHPEATSPDCQVAVEFMNAYVTFCMESNPRKDGRKWINEQVLLTAHFKTTYVSLMDSAEAVDPEMGLGFDPIFDAQDFPDNGFTVDSCDLETGYVFVSGIDWPEFKLVLRVTIDDEQSFVDGAGIINIPADKRSPR